MDLEKSITLVIISLVIINGAVILFTQPKTIHDAALTVFDVSAGVIVGVLAMGGLAEAIDNVATTLERPAVSLGLYGVVAAFFIRIVFLYKQAVVRDAGPADTR